MLDTILAWVYLWPVLFVSAGLSVVVLLLTLNLFLSGLLTVVYFLLPPEMIQGWIGSLVTLVRSKFESYFENVETNLRQTFPIHLEAPLPKTSLLLWHPHSLMGVTPVLHVAYRLTNALPPSKIVCHSMYHTIPVLRDIATYCHSAPARFADMKHELESGNSLSVIPGGTREMMETEERVLRLILKKRSGVFRLALTSGTPLVPILSYGENELFPSIRTPWLDGINEILYKLFWVALPLTSWTALSNWVKLYSHPLDQITTHVGKPLNVEKVEEPTQEDIDRLRKRYIRRVTKLFKKTAPEGYKLIIQE
jgi:hypothetical protein